MKKSLEVGRAAMTFSLSAIRALPADFVQNLDQSASLDGRLNVVAANFEGKDAKNVK